MRIRYKILPVALVASLLALALPYLVWKYSFLVAISDNAVRAATVLGSITGPVLSFCTLLIVLGTFFLESGEKNMRLSLDLIERLVSIYGGLCNEYERLGTKQTYYDETGQLRTGVIQPYLERADPLFREVITRLKTSGTTSSRYRALVTILQTLLCPLVEMMRREAERLENEPGTQIAQRQLRDLASLNR